jgi:predicted RNA binding protein YcfA (HicA-like mRNA interferase family)
MPRFGPVNRRKFTGFLRQLGFSGPFSGGRHQFMQKGTLTVILPNPHRRDIGRKLLSKLPHQAEIDRSTWEAL